MERRSELQSILETILGSRQVYFQSPGKQKMAYPSIIYRLAGDDVKFADNRVYSRIKRYSILVIDPDPDSLIPDKVGDLPRCASEKPYISENLNHFPFTIYF